MSQLYKALEIIRHKAKTETELGSAFESLAKVFLENDATQTQQYSKVWHYSDWAKNQKGYTKKDIGIDLIAKLRDEDGYCAIQCKFYKSDHSISKADLDSFISASSTSDFKRLVLIDTSTQPISQNAQQVFDNLTQEYIRIQLSELEESRIDWSSYINDGSLKLHSKKELRDHQIKALNAIRDGLKNNDRGKMIMACGTGKTLTSLRIAEDLAGKGKKVLYMVPSLALMSQTIREWKNDAKDDFIAFSACSDNKVGKKESTNDLIEVNLNDLAFPATTDAKKLAKQVEKSDQAKMIVIFSTYHSIDVISESQIKYNLDEFDLIVCDEAHRTTGATLVDEDESNFVKIHSNENVKGKKRLYMTATPRIYGDTARKKEDEGEVTLASMDDKNIYGETLFHRGFGWAVENDLLTDYKVVVLMMDEQIVSDRIQSTFTKSTELELDDATKMIGCYKALAKVGLDEKDDQIKDDPKPMKKALAFCQNIRTSQIFSSEFSNVVNDYSSHEDEPNDEKTDLKVELFHVDGTFNAEQRNEKLRWLKEDTDKNTCRVLTNARCLSEGVDVPSLDAIMFLHPRKSQIDVVQSVGRVMRKSEGKKMGYVILPITVAPGVSAEKALNDNERYEVVWQILNALRAHDERFDSTINRIGLGEDVSNRLEIIDGTSSSEIDATTAVVEDIKPPKKKEDDDDEGETNLGIDDIQDTDDDVVEQLSFTLTDLSHAIKAKIVEKCGTRDYWENWANDIAKIAEKHIVRISSIVLNSGTSEHKSFMNFVEEIRDDLNPEITENDAVEMLAQHIITRPVFDTLFQGNRFTSENAVSKAMEKVLSQIYSHNIDTETRTLEKFYDSVKRRANDIITSTGRQALIIQLYDRFFRNAFPLMTQKLGIVYTPVEVVDFIIHSVEGVMKEEFKTSLANDGVHILDPFTGTGTFISRLLQSGVIPKERIKDKFKKEIHANEIVLLAYYIACINIEAVYDDILKENEYQSFDGILLTDTFQLYEQDRDMIANLLPDNSQRRMSQKEQNIQVIIGNPPYSAGQTSANDNAANLKYKNLDNRIEITYSNASTATNKTGLYDSYIRSFRWASDRIGENGVIGFVTNGGWVDGNASDGFRKCLKDEFSKIYLFHLRGNARTSGELRRKEKGNVFGGGTRTPIVITILVKNKNSKEQGKIFFKDIGDYLDKEEKLSIVKNFRSIYGIKNDGGFSEIIPDKNNDWVNQGDERFDKFIPLGLKSNELEQVKFFEKFSIGVGTSRDAWNYNSSLNKLKKLAKSQSDFYNSEVDRYEQSDQSIPVEKFINLDPKKISWNRSLRNDLRRLKKHKFDDSEFVLSHYRPFFKQHLYFNKMLNNDIGKLKNFLYGQDNGVFISVTGTGSKNGFSALMSKELPDMQLMFNGQNFPLKIYDDTNISSGDDLFSSVENKDQNIELENISSNSLNFVRKKYKENKITRLQILYYIYGIFHSSEYKKLFENNLSKTLPRVPLLKKTSDFWKYVEYGEKLKDLHVDYENVKPHPIKYKEEIPSIKNIDDAVSFYRVKKMKFNKNDKTTIIYNQNITIEDIPINAYDYIVNGKTAIEWVMDRQCIKTNKDSGIINDANDYANETMKNPAYPLELLQRVITVSLETMKIVKKLPKLNI